MVRGHRAVSLARAFILLHEGERLILGDTQGHDHELVPFCWLLSCHRHSYFFDDTSLAFTEFESFLCDTLVKVGSLGRARSLLGRGLCRPKQDLLLYHVVEIEEGGSCLDPLHFQI